MAHIAVQLQRTPQGLHPASAVALCWARDIGSARGATVTAVCIGDAGDSDRRIAAAAARFGADVLLFGGPNGLKNLRERLNPVHVLVPFTPQGLAAASTFATGPVVPRWIAGRSPPYATADALTAIAAGVRPWHRFELELDPEYEGDVDEVDLPEFITDGDAPVFDLGARPLGYVAPDKLDPAIVGALEGLGATPTTWDAAPHRSGGTTVVLLDAGGQLPPVAARDDPGRVIVLLGSDAPPPDDAVPPAWRHVDWLLPGRWADVIGSLREGPWTSAPT